MVGGRGWGVRDEEWGGGRRGGGAREREREREREKLGRERVGEAQELNNRGLHGA
jgi:hypothetical protein